MGAKMTEVEHQRAPKPTLTTVTLADSCHCTRFILLTLLQLLFYHVNTVTLSGRARLKLPQSIWGAPIPVLTNRKYLPIVDKKGALDRLGRSNRARPVEYFGVRLVSCKKV